VAVLRNLSDDALNAKLACDNFFNRTNLNAFHVIYIMRLAVLTAVIRGFTQFLHANTEILP
jgi:hypothetical protein